MQEGGGGLHVVDVIRKKQGGQSLSSSDIRLLIDGLMDDSLSQEEIETLIASIRRVGLSEEETLDLTQAIAESGETVDLSPIPGMKVGKISTGGVGDKLSLVALPAVAALGLSVAHLSLRGFGPYGGTIDKLSSIPGFRTSLERRAFLDQVLDIGIAVTEKPATLAPAADRMMNVIYTSVTRGEEDPDGGSVLPPSLGVAIFMGRLLAGGYDALLVDVKVGSGALLRTEADARLFADLWVRLSERFGKKGTAMIVNMNQPHGQEVGYANEVREAVDVLKGQGPDDILGASMRLGGEMLLLAQKFETIDDAVHQVHEVIRSGEALLKFKEWVERQGADSSFIHEPSLLPQPEYEVIIGAQAEGVLLPVDAGRVGEALLLANGGRRRPHEPIDLACGVTIYYKESEKVSRGEALARLVATRDIPDEAAEKLVSAFQMTDQNIMYSHTVIDVVKQEVVKPD